MTERNNTETMASNGKEGALASTGGTKKAYVAPAILTIEPLEAVATTCTDPGAKGYGEPACATGPIQS